MTDFFDLKIDSHFTTELPADEIKENFTRQVKQACFSFTKTKKPSNPEQLHVSEGFLKELNIVIDDKKAFLKLMSGQMSLNNYQSYAMCYGGHQFGHWAGQLGDGRAINVADYDIDGKSWQFQLKGAGPTPYSRGSDGLAVLRSSIREYLCSEAMHCLGIPTTRALSIVKTGDMVRRDMLYDGNPADEHGAIVCRVSPSFIRFGSFEIFSARGDEVNLKKLLDYTINHHFPDLGPPSKETYIEFFREVSTSTMKTILHWQRVGFVHGVMNTDNMSILGLTIDYGPYGWLENYDPNWTPNTTDARDRRYRFGGQPSIGLWNLLQLANTIYPMIKETEPLQEILEDYRSSFVERYHIMMCEKLGLYKSRAVKSDFVKELETNLEKSEIDMTIFFRELSENSVPEFDLFWKVIEKSTYLGAAEIENEKAKWNNWFSEFGTYVESEDESKRLEKMKEVNPKYVLRNWMAQLAIDDANEGKYELLAELYALLQNPYTDQAGMEKWYAKRPDWAMHKVGCSMLSCSS